MQSRNSALKPIKPCQTPARYPPAGKERARISKAVASHPRGAEQPEPPFRVVSSFYLLIVSLLLLEETRALCPFLRRLS